MLADTQVSTVFSCNGLSCQWHTALSCVTVHRPLLTLPQNDNRQQTHSAATASSLCVYLCDRSGQRGQVWPSVRLSQRKHRTEQAIFSNPLWFNSLFSHQSPWNCSVSLNEQFWWHRGQQTRQSNRRKPGVRQRWGGVGEQIKREATKKQLI